MYIKETYSPKFYVELLASRAKIDELSSTSYASEEKRNLLIKLGVQQIKTGSKRSTKASISSRRVLPINIDMALRAVANETVSYLEKHRSQFEQDFKDGKLEGLLGEQKEFVFSGRLGHFDFNHVRLSRADAIAHFAYAK
jgi:hypothetical protein